jgi:glycosyltransferase involved in cell wall biosynthesis
MNPLVSVVIPTRNRPDSVLRAVASVSAQTFREIEIVVVIDGPDSETVVALTAAQASEPRLRFLALDHNQGGSGARNRGIEAAKGDWIALLDDDDEWLPHKLVTQFPAVMSIDTNRELPIVATKLYAHTGDGRTMVWPRYPPTLPLSEYLFCRRSLAYGDAMLQTSTLLAPRSLFLRVPFTEGLKKRQDYDWILRATAAPDVTVRLIHEPLVIWKIWYDGSTVSNRADWRHSLDWIRSCRHLITGRAYAGFLATDVARDARDQKRWGHFFPLLLEMARHGDPRLFDYAVYFSSWVPSVARRFFGGLGRQSETEPRNLINS